MEAPDKSGVTSLSFIDKTINYNELEIGMMENYLNSSQDWCFTA